MLLFSYPSQSSCDPLYFTLVLLEVTPRIPQQCQLQFEVYSVSKELLFTASQISLEGCTEEESDQYAQVCTIECVFVSPTTTTRKFEKSNWHTKMIC